MSQANDIERLMLGLINSERSAAGVAPLSFNDDLNEASEDHSQWMLDTDTFSHTGTDGSSAGDRIVTAGYDLEGNWAWGENIGWQSERGAPGLADDVQDIHDNLMNSPGHRANILSAEFDEIGIGIEQGDFGRFDSVMVTQNFGRTDATPSSDPIADTDDVPVATADPDIPDDTPLPHTGSEPETPTSGEDDTEMPATAEEGPSEPTHTTDNHTPDMEEGDTPEDADMHTDDPTEMADDETPSTNDDTDTPDDAEQEGEEPVDTADGDAEDMPSQDDMPDPSDLPEVMQMVENLLDSLREQINDLIDQVDADQNFDMADLLPGEAGSGEPMNGSDDAGHSEPGGCGTFYDVELDSVDHGAPEALEMA